jgi:L-seryl-tRNA(Ser) seleniumtransferase
LSGERDARRGIPSVDRLLRTGAAGPLIATWGRRAVADALRAELGALRVEGGGEGGVTESDPILARVESRLETKGRGRLRRVLNATGVVLHTNLGRAPLSTSALERVRSVAGGYANLEYDLEVGARGDRYAHCADLVRELTGAEDALVVNNAAAALVLAVHGIARGRSVLVARGELVEIGGSFRLPEIIRAAGGLLVEVGTTNRTRVGDYRRAAGPDAGLILKVHPSNYRIEGFTEEASLSDLVELGRELGVPVAHDLGSGLLAPEAVPGLPAAPTPSDSTAAGADLTLWSGDKLLGGPQAGVLHGRRRWIEPLRREPLLRALRVDKMTLAALEDTLLCCRDPGRAVHEIPVLARLSEPADSVRARAERARGSLPDGVRSRVRIVPLASVVGAGSLPGTEIPSAGWRLDGPAEPLDRALRAGEPPLVGRIADDALCLDFRTIPPGDEPEVARLVATALADDGVWRGTEA